ncbi:MAG: hypothetical protein AB1637_08490 [Elusimicrobiota bacterium]
MKKTVVLLLFLSVGCSSAGKKIFSSKDVIITKMSSSSFDAKEDVSKAAQIACGAFEEYSCLGAEKYVKKSFLKKESSGLNGDYFYAKHYFDTQAFISSRESKNSKAAFRARFYVSFYSPQEKAYEYFTSSLKEGCFESSCLYFQNSPFPQEFSKEEDFAVSAEVYSYNLNNPINSASTFVSSAAVKIYYSPDKKQAASFVVSESATSFDINEAAYKSLSACGAAAVKQAETVMKEYISGIKKIKIIFSRTSDLNTLAEIRSVLNAVSPKKAVLLSYRQEEAVFSMPAYSMPEEILAGEIMRRGDLRFNIEYIDKGELKFSVGENVVNR